MAPRVLPAPGAPRMLALAQLTNSIGDGAYVVCSALYFGHIVGLSAAELGLAFAIAWGVGALSGVPLGALADRRGPRVTAVFLALATGTAVASFLFVRSFWPFLASMVLYACCQSGLGAARQALLATLVAPAERTRTRAYLQSTANAGMAVGAALGGLAVTVDSRPAYLAAFCLDAVAFVLAAGILSRLPRGEHVPPKRGDGPRLAVLRDRPYAVVTALNTVMLLYMPLLSLIIPLWIVQRTEAPRWMVSASLVINTLSVMLFQVRVARGVRDLGSAVRYMRRAGLIMLVCCGVFALSAAGTSPWFAGAVLAVAAGLQVLGEMTQASGSWEIGFGLAPDGSQGQYQGFFGTGVPVARMVGPVALGALILGWGPPGWLVMGGVFLAAGLLMGPAVRWAERTRTTRAPEPEAVAA